MKSILPPPLFAPKTSSWRISLRWTGLLLVWIALTICFFQPSSFPLDGNLDPSIFAAYAYYTAHHFQYGTQIAAMAGPYGFVMYGQFYGGDLFWLRLFLELFIEAIFSAWILYFFLRMSPRSVARWIWLFAHILFSTILPDLSVAWTMLLAALFLLEKPRARFGAVYALGAGTLAFLALLKNTHLILSLATLGVVTITWLLQRQWKRAGIIVIAYVSTFLAAWMLAWQNPVNLPAFIISAFHLVQGYTDSMSLAETPAIFWRGATLAIGLMVGLIFTAWLRRREPLQLVGLVLIAVYLFVMWKHGFVRADQHVVIFFSFAVVAALTCYLQFFSRKEHPSPKGKWVAAGFTAFLIIGGLGKPGVPLFDARERLAAAWPSFTYRFHYLLSLPKGKEMIEKLLAEQRKARNLPRVRDEIGTATIDFFGVEQGVIILNGFNYHPRPMGGGAFNAYNHYLMAQNRDFVRDPKRRPAYYLLKLAPIDERQAMQEDHLLLETLLYQYRPVFLERGNLLLRAVPDLPEAPKPDFVVKKDFRFGEIVTLPEVGHDKLLLARFSIQKNFKGQLRSMLYKTSALFLDLRGEDQKSLGSYRLVPALAETEFIFSPLITNTREWLELYGHETEARLRSFALQTKEPSSFKKTLSVEFFTLPRPPAVDVFTLNGLRTHFRFPFANIEPETITPSFQADPDVHFLHAPAEAVWPLTGLERKLTFHYGLAPEAYTKGTTDGVKFIVEIRNPSGGVQQVFSRLLDPLSIPIDRGRQTADLTLPIYPPGSRLVLRTDPGKDQDTAWDWSYVSQIEIKQSVAFPAGLFNGFHRLPDAATAEAAAAIKVENQDATFLHIPYELSFQLKGAEQSLDFYFGFLPGAYTKDGHSPGVVLIVEIQRRGETSREIFHRTFLPVTVPTDRGTQKIAVAIPKSEPGDTLIVRAIPPSGTNNNWGWTYIQQLNLR